MEGQTMKLDRQALSYYRPTLGDKVTVRWGYGRGFTAQGKGRVVRVFAKSCRVELLKAVPSPNGKGEWPKGHVLNGMPYSLMQSKWDAWNCVLPRREEA